MDVLFYFLLSLATYFATVYLFLALRFLFRKISSAMGHSRQGDGVDQERQGSDSG